MEKNSGNTVANLVIDELDGIKIGFRRAELRETINGVLPTLVATFVCETDKFPLGLSEINMTLTINNKEWVLIGNVDEMRFDINIVTIYITLTPRDFYFKSNSNKYLSINEVVETLYFGKSIQSNVTDNSPRELNQVGVTDYKFLNTALRSMSSPSVFSYTINSLVITSLENYEVSLDVDPKIYNYNVEKREKTYSTDRKSYAEINEVGVTTRNGEEDSSLLSWDGINITHNSELSDLFNNMIINSKYQKSNRLTLNVVFQYVPDISCGQVIRIDIPNIDVTEFLVIERLGIVASEMKFRYKLREI